MGMRIKGDACVFIYLTYKNRKAEMDMCKWNPICATNSSNSNPAIYHDAMFDDDENGKSVTQIKRIRIMATNTNTEDRTRWL